MEKKIVNDAAAYIRSYVSKRGRNAQLAELGVTESRSFTAEEALKENLIDAVVSENDSMAIGMISGLAKRGLSVPGDVSVIGMDDAPDSRYVLPALSTVAVPRNQMLPSL